MAVSLEVRWFRDGAIPNDLAHWFHDVLERTPSLLDTEERTDEYLQVTGCDHVGLKLRAGRDLELKLRENVFGTSSFRPDVRGTVERWRKLTVPGRFEDEQLRGADRRTVRKLRTSRKYAYARTEVQPVAVASRIAAGALVELTALQIADNPWWTLGFEAFGAPAVTLSSSKGESQSSTEADTALRACLHTVASHVLERYTGPPLSEDCSFGYPHWLLAQPEHPQASSP